MNTKKKILVVEDEKPLAHAMELKLTHEGFDAHVVSNGEAALEALDKEGFDLVLCDLVMPKMDGFQVLEKMREKKLQIPVIILSNLTQEEDQKKAAALGAKDFFVKSDTPLADLVTHVRKVLA